MPSTRRLAFIDLLRGMAVLVMIETHVVNATVERALTAMPWFEVVNFINGLVAPTFLFASGMAYAVTMRRKLDGYLGFGTPLVRQLWRLVFILIVAYVLHLPTFSLERTLAGLTERQYLAFVQADVLHCIAVTLLILQVSVFILRTERRLAWFATASAVIVLFVTPLMWGVDWLGVMPAPFAAYLNGLHLSLFPLFPWSVFILAGVVAGHLFGVQQDRAPGSAGPDYPVRPFAVAGGVLMAMSFVLIPLAHVYPTYNYWRYSPAFVVLRLGIVVLFAAGAMLYERRRGVGAGSIVTLIGRESLLIYAAHLILLYGNLGPFNFRRWSDHTFNLAESLAWTAVFIVLMIVLARVWDRVRGLPPARKRWIQGAITAGFVIAFILGPS